MILKGEKVSKCNKYSTVPKQTSATIWIAPKLAPLLILDSTGPRDFRFYGKLFLGSVLLLHGNPLVTVSGSKELIMGTHFCNEIHLFLKSLRPFSFTSLSIYQNNGLNLPISMNTGTRHILMQWKAKRSL